MSHTDTKPIDLDDPRLQPGAYIEKDNELWHVLDHGTHLFVDGKLARKLENCRGEIRDGEMAFETRAIPCESIVTSYRLVTRAPDTRPADDQVNELRAEIEASQADIR